MATTDDIWSDMNAKKWKLVEEIRNIDSYNKYLDAVVDDGNCHNYCGPVGDQSFSGDAYKQLFERTISNSPAFVLPLSKPLGNLDVWLTDGARVPVPPRVEVPKTNFVFEPASDSDAQHSRYLEDLGDLQRALAGLKEVVTNRPPFVDTYNKRVNDYCQHQDQVHAEVLAVAQAIQQRMKVCREDGDLSGLAAAMQDLMAFLFRRVDLVGMRNTRKHMVLAVESRTAFVQVQFPDCSGVDMYVGTMASGKPKFASASAKKKLIQASLYSTAIYFGHLVGRFGLPEVFDTVVVNVEQDWFDPATGHPRNGIVASLQAKREVFANLDLEKVDPVACFRELKGLSTPNMNVPTPIRPIMQLQTTDARFVESRNVDLEIDPQSNLAAMDWEDFEHLIAQLMEWEFARSGVEVRVTRASRDRGVDAVMFDPDPLRGGKYVLQAKRYTRTVDVSAVRDLYGTLLNEGANRGILITTASFGPDAYEFAKDKPLSLVDGPNLLNLLSRHGKTFRIDLDEARQLQVEG